MAGGSKDKEKKDRQDKEKPDSEKATSSKGVTANAESQEALVTSMTAAITASMTSGFQEMSQMLTDRLYQEEDMEEGYEFEEYDESGLDDDLLQQEVAAKRMADLEESIGNAPKKARVEQGRAFDLLETLVGGQKSNPAEENGGASVKAGTSRQKLLEEIEQDLESESAGPEIPQDMATVLNKLMEEGLPEEKLNTRLNRYKRPSNCPKW
jgi:hypothetical protein